MEKAVREAKRLGLTAALLSGLIERGFEEHGN